MNLHEFQSKDLFRKYGIPVPKGAIATTPNEAKSVAHELGGEKWLLRHKFIVVVEVKREASK